MITIATGFPGSGKSDLIDQMCLNMARDHGWKTIFCSFEKPPTYHIAQLSQKLTGRNFFKGDDFNPRMTEAERDYGKDFCDEHFMFMDASKGAPTDIEGILDMASAAVMRMGCRILVIDPYNYISVDRNAMETDAISDMISQVRIWALEHQAHVFFVAHPAKPAVRVGKYICSGLDVSKSMAWFAKADIGWTTWRGPDNEAEFHVWKVRWGWMGTVGHCGLSHDVVSSRWADGHGFSGNDEWGDTTYDF
jgi:twinkle protein